MRSGNSKMMSRWILLIWLNPIVAQKCSSMVASRRSRKHVFKPWFHLCGLPYYISYKKLWRRECKNICAITGNAKNNCSQLVALQPEPVASLCIIPMVYVQYIIKCYHIIWIWVHCLHIIPTSFFYYLHCVQDGGDEQVFLWRTFSRSL